MFISVLSPWTIIKCMSLWYAMSPHDSDLFHPHSEFSHTSAFNSNYVLLHFRSCYTETDKVINSVRHQHSKLRNTAISFGRYLCQIKKKKSNWKKSSESSGHIYKCTVGDIIEIPYSPADHKLRVYFDWCDLSWHRLLVLPSNDVLLCQMMGSTHGQLLLLSEPHILSRSSPIIRHTFSRRASKVLSMRNSRDNSHFRPSVSMASMLFKHDR